MGITLSQIAVPTIAVLIVVGMALHRSGFFSKGSRKRSKTEEGTDHSSEPESHETEAVHTPPPATPAGGGGHAHDHDEKKMPWWLKLPLFIFLTALALSAAAWMWHLTPAEVKAVPRVRDTSAATATASTTLAALRCQGTDKVIATIGPGESVLVSLDEGVTMDTFPSAPNLVISPADDPTRSTSNGGTLDAPSHFFRVHNTRAKGGSEFYFGCTYR